MRPVSLEQPESPLETTKAASLYSKEKYDHSQSRIICSRRVDCRGGIAHHCIWAKPHLL